MLTPLGAMQLAIQEAKRGLGFVAPNPPVGAVIVDRDGQFLSKGYHSRFGGDHAEIAAIKNLEADSSRFREGASLEGATIYVTLEPCAHEGKTPSCAKRLVTLPLRRVVYGLVDPNPRVAGQGLQILRDAGKEVLSIEQAMDVEASVKSRLQNELENLPEIFLWNQRHKKTFVALKVATTLDGCLAHVTGESGWLTGDPAKQMVHELRAQYDAVLVGKETFLKDNPRLNVRSPRFQDKLNTVVILDSKAELTLEQIENSNIAKVRPAENIYIARTVAARSDQSRDEFLSKGFQLLHCQSTAKNQIDLDSLLKLLYDLNILSIFVEGGARVHSSFLQENCVNRIYQFIAPKILGGANGLSFTRDLKVQRFSDLLQLRSVETQVCGEDVFITGRLK